MTPAASTISPCLGTETAAAYVTHDLEVSEVRLVDAHIARCAPCRRRLSDLARVLTSATSASSSVMTPSRGGVLKRGAAIGRYVVEEPLGAGGMGVVYAARDPQLHRRVALKVVRGGMSSDPAREERLLGEARAMAKLSHPNVVAVHDLVFTGGRLYVAMEIVDGVSLKVWLRSERRTWRSILHTFVQAGRGLAAAHAAGLVHRDFKPANVLYGAHGRVCVTDFGLAQSTARDADRTTPMPTRPSARVVEGTPAYMAPEQERGELADARSDQFSFCIALAEALSQVTVPSHVRRALERGMSANPALRHASMDALLDALTNDRRPVVFGIVTTVAVLAIAAALVLRLRHEQSERRNACAASASKIGSVWNDARRQAAANAFSAIPGNYGREAWRNVSETLTRRAAAWASLRANTCETAIVDIPVASLPDDERMICLDERLRELDALAAELPAVGTVEAAAAAMVAADTLEPVTSCSRARTRTTTRRTQGRSKLDEARSALARVRTLRSVGKVVEAAKEAERLRETAEALHDEALLAQVLLEAAQGNRSMRKLDAAEDQAFRAAALADAMGDDPLRARAWSLLLLLQGLRHDEKAAAHSYAQAMAVVARLEDGSRDEAAVRSNHSTVLYIANNFTEALDEARRSVAIYEKIDSPLALSRSLDQVGLAESALGRFAAWRADTGRARDIAAKLLGSTHPSVRAVEHNLALVCLNQADFSEAFEHAHEARISNELVGDTSPKGTVGLASSRLLEAQTLISLGRPAEALALLELVLPVVDGETSDATAGLVFSFALSSFGRAYVELGQPERALPYLERALAQGSKVDSTLLAEIKFSLAKALTALRRDPKRARTLATEAAALLGDPKENRYGALALDAIREWLAAPPPTATPNGRRHRTAAR